MWHVLQDPSNNQFFRLNEAAYRFVGLLDGQRTVSQAWNISNEQFGDMSPTQGEVIQLLGQLYSSNLLMADLPPDSEGLLKRYRKRVNREVRGYLSNLLFIRIPLLDPDHFLNRWVGILGSVFSWLGFILWAILICYGFSFVLKDWDQAVSQAKNFFDQQRLADNALLMFISFWGIKIFHEFGHAFSCKKFGANSGSGGEVHVMGIMFMVFTPIPYVDASSSWAFRRKWHRAIVGAAGMYIEMALAAVAAIVWANTVPDTLTHSLAYNVMFIGSVTTLVFNGNPLLRYDGYYILSDLIEIPNLAQRSKDYLYYLVKKYVWRVRQPRNPAHTVGERIWFVIYGIASTIYRTLVVVSILYFVYKALPVLGAVLAAAAAVAWAAVPLFKFLGYLFTNQELSRSRGLAMSTTLGFVLLLVASLGIIRAPDHIRATGVVEPHEKRVVNMQSEGTVVRVAKTDQPVKAGDTLVQGENRELAAQLDIFKAELESYQVVRERARAAMQDLRPHDERIHNTELRIKDMERQLKELTLSAPISGMWVLLNPNLIGAYVKSDQPFGQVVSGELIIRAVVSQEDAPRILSECMNNADEKYHQVELRVDGRPDLFIKGTIIKAQLSATKRLPSQALGFGAGGPIAVDPQDKKGATAEEPVLEVEIKPETGSYLAEGQRIAVRFITPPKPLAQQWWLKLIRILPATLQP